ncbi:carboxypeptidase regulatory-like domain-containing protein [Desulfitobacterium sp. Sab5]|uniref:carboxypeptidase-like regulatory domain-containing protein n=1 Tax=Desulfitobacterium nosdiversum TaxID=3375356 RepID=UPI003CEED75A
MLKRKLSLLVILIFALTFVVGYTSFASAAVTTGISGTVKDIDTGAAIAGATITDGTTTVTTNAQGIYSLSKSAGSYTLKISASGYLTTWQTCTVTSGAVTTVNWSLTKAYGTQTPPAYAQNMRNIIFAWNDLGMHCDQDDYSYFCVLPPYNTLHVQVINRPNLLTSGITVSYNFPKKTNSTLHTNFWQYSAQYGWNVPTNTGISGTQLAGTMKLDSNGKGFVAEGIPITPYDDDGTWDPYGTANITVTDSNNNVLQTASVVAPVSTEMNCNNCHGNATVNPQLDILQKHDSHNGTTLAADQAQGKVHLCSECHSDNALGKPGVAGVESLSLAMHNFHKDKMTYTPAAANVTPSCYNCHPGTNTQCLRGIMEKAGKSCTDCHGDMNGMTTSLQNGRQAWLQEPKCVTCHDSKHTENTNTLYRNSIMNNSLASDMNGKFYCEACHNSTHGEFVSANSADPTIPQKFQGDNYWIWNCKVCHQQNYTQRNFHN